MLRSILSRAHVNTSDGELHQGLAWAEDRLEGWRDRHVELAGVQIDRKTRVLTYAGKSIRLTQREAHLLDFMLRHPKRAFTSKQLATLAWQNSRLSDAQFRTYIMRLRSRLHEIGLEQVLGAVRNQGYQARIVGVASTP